MRNSPSRSLLYFTRSLFIASLFVGLFAVITSGVGLAHAQVRQSQRLLSNSNGTFNFFTHVATSANTFGDYTDLNNSAINNKPNLLVFVTHVWTSSSNYNDHPLGVWYHNGKWSIFNEDQAVMQVGLIFNVAVDPTDSDTQAFDLVATSENGDQDYVSLPPISNAEGFMLVSPNWNQGGASPGVYDPHPIGVFYDSPDLLWDVYNEDLRPMPQNAAFNVYNLEQAVLGSTGGAYIQIADTSNTQSDYTGINSLPFSLDPQAALFVTPNLTPPWKPSVSNVHPVGVFYNTTNQPWCIFNEDKASMPDGAAFNVLFQPDVTATA